MLLIETRLKRSRIHGIGLFADKRIRKGTKIWRYSKDIDLVLSPKNLQHLAEPSRKQITAYIYKDIITKQIVLCGDDARYFNHSNTPNVIDVPGDPYLCIAKRNIRKGEELTHNYYCYDSFAKSKLKKTNANK